jgi:hypothetical protein
VNELNTDPLIKKPNWPLLACHNKKSMAKKRDNQKDSRDQLKFKGEIYWCFLVDFRFAKKFVLDSKIYLSKYSRWNENI